MKKMQKGTKSGALNWAARSGILSADEPSASVTREELADALYRGLEHFFGEIVALLEGGTSKNGGEG